MEARPGIRVPIQVTDRFTRFIDLLGSNGGRYQAPYAKVAEAVGVTPEQLRTIYRRAVDLELVRIETHSSYIGFGRAPNSYHLLIDWEDWPALRELAEAAHMAKMKYRAPPGPKVKAPVRVWPPPGQLPPPVAPPARELAPEVAESLDVEAWAWAGDF